MLKRGGGLLIILACCWPCVCQPDTNTPPVSSSNTLAVSSANSIQSNPIPALPQSPPANTPDNNAQQKSSGNFWRNMSAGERTTAILTILAMLAGLFAWLWSQFHKNKEDSGNSTLVKVGNNNSGQVAGHDINTTTNNGLDLEKLLNKLTEEAGNRGKLEGEIDRLNVDLANALNRVKELKNTGRHNDAVAALESIRKSGDAAQLQSVLIADKNQHKDALIERNREISAIAYLRGDIDIALAAVDEILKLLPDDLDAINRKGFICQLRGNLPEAIQCYEKILQLAKKQNHEQAQAAAYNNLGNVYRIRGDKQKAREYYLKSIALYRKIGALHKVEKIEGLLKKLDAGK